MGTCARQPDSKAYDHEGKDRIDEQCARFGKPSAGRYFAGLLRLGRDIRWRLNLYPAQSPDKSVSAARECFNVSRRLGGVTEHLAQTRNSIMQTMVKIDEGV